MTGATKVHGAKSSTAQPNGQHLNGGPKVVGPNVRGKREEYQLVRRLQTALFGGVYEAKGLTSGRDFAIKVLHKSELSKAQETSSIEFCEVPLSEIRFAELMRNHVNIMEPEEHFEDGYCFYVVFELARGGDLLEALKQKPHGFEEGQAQYMIRQAAKGLAALHTRHVAMQDVSLENMLLYLDEASGNWEVKVCDPGQAVIFDVDKHGQELNVGFRGLVGKSFRPPELHEQRAYQSTKVDSWCLGWSTFYLLTAQPLFMSADPLVQDVDWLHFQQCTRPSDYNKLFQHKSNLCSGLALDFIFRLLQIEPENRLSIAQCLEHPWLADPTIAPVPAPKEFMPEKKQPERWEEAPQPVLNEIDQGSGTITTSTRIPGSPTNNAPRAAHLGGSHLGGTSGAASVAASQPPTSGTWTSTPGPSEYPSWTTPVTSYVHPTPTLRVRSPMRSPRSSVASTVPAHRIPMDRRGRAQMGLYGPHAGSAARAPYIIATAHSPAPVMTPSMQPPLGARASGPRTSSPQPSWMEQQAMVMPRSLQGPPMQVAMQGMVQMEATTYIYEPQRPPFITPRSTSRPKTMTPANTVPAPISLGMKGPFEGENARGRPWVFRPPDMPEESKRMGSDPNLDLAGRSRAVSPLPMHAVMSLQQPRVAIGPGYAGTAQGRHVQSPARSHAIYMPRSPSPMQLDMQQANAAYVSRPPLRSPSPAGAPRPQLGFTWSSAPSMSPRGGISMHATMARAPSPPGMLGAPMVAPRSMGFAWLPLSPDPPSPRSSPRAFSPAPMGGSNSFPQGLPVGGPRAAMLR